MIVKMDMNEEKWINEVMSSLDDVKSAEANPFLYHKVLNKISLVKMEYTPVKLIWLAAASFILLILLNFQVIRTLSSKNKKTEIREIASQYNLITTNSINYND
jgi:hypothetical protein